MAKIAHLVNHTPTIIETKTDVKGKRQENIPLTVTRRVLSLIGALPCSGKSPYWPSLDRKRSNVVYNAVVIIIATANVLWTLVQKRVEYDETDPSKIVRRTVLQNTTIVLSPHVAVFLMWVDASEYHHFMTLINNFQVKFQQTTGRPFKNHTETIEKIISLSILVAIPSFYYFCSYFVTDLDRNPVVALAVLYGNTIGAYIVISWSLVAIVIIYALEDMQNEFKQLLRSDNLTANTVFQFRLLWISLREACDSISRWRACSIGYNACMFLTILFVYQTLAFSRAGNFIVAVGVFMPSIIYSGVIIVVCIASHSLQEKMKILVREILPNISLASYNRQIQREILMLYMIESARSAVTTFDGFLTVNRHLLLSFLSNIVTYIIFLVQFAKKNSYFIA